MNIICKSCAYDISYGNDLMKLKSHWQYSDFNNVFQRQYKFNFDSLRLKL